MAKPKGVSTEQFVEIEEIRGPVVILKDGSLRVIVEAMSVNFELKGEDEKISIIRGFQGFLNSVDFPIQIVIDSRKLDIANYIASLETMVQRLNNELLKVHATDYLRFVRGLADLTNVVSKRFYIVIPYYSSELTKGKEGILNKVTGIFGSKKKDKGISDENLQKYVVQLEQRVAVIRNGIEAIGVKTKVLEQDALASVFYSYYNPRPI
jgi:uncharacterized small protein (DUF1192 family)